MNNFNTWSVGTVAFRPLFWDRWVSITKMMFSSCLYDKYTKHWPIINQNIFEKCHNAYPKNKYLHLSATFWDKFSFWQHWMLGQEKSVFQILFLHDPEPFSFRNYLLVIWIIFVVRNQPFFTPLVPLILQISFTINAKIYNFEVNSFFSREQQRSWAISSSGSMKSNNV